MFFLAWGVSWFVVAQLCGPILGRTLSAFCGEHDGDPVTCGHSLGSVKPTPWRAALPFRSPVCGEMWALAGRDVLGEQGEGTCYSG